MQIPFVIDNQIYKMAEVQCFKKCLPTTEKLIDQIVYKLYGLTEDEIKIVEGK